jgi:hypothetical protein
MHERRRRRHHDMGNTSQHRHGGGVARKRHEAATRNQERGAKKMGQHPSGPRVLPEQSRVEGVGEFCISDPLHIHQCDIYFVPEPRGSIYFPYSLSIIFFTETMLY